MEHLAFRDRLLRRSHVEPTGLCSSRVRSFDRDLRDLLGIDLDGEGERARRWSPRASTSAPSTLAGADAASAVPVRGSGQNPGRCPGRARHHRGGPCRENVGPLPAGHHGRQASTASRAWQRSSRRGRRDPDLHGRCNLLVVGGDLDDPSADEAAELALVDALVPIPVPCRRRGAAAARTTVRTPRWRRGSPRPAGRGLGRAARGMYVSASLKEEFGLAILEAMAAWLVVVAPGRAAGRHVRRPVASRGCCLTPRPLRHSPLPGAPALAMATSPETAPTAERHARDAP